MKEEIKKYIAKLVKSYKIDVKFDIFYPPEGFGDYSTNVAFVLAKQAGGDVLEIAGKISRELEKKFKKEFKKVEVAKNGFINFYLSEKYLTKKLKVFLKKKIKVKKVKAKKINIEFVSANPTGPLTLGNARAAAYGDTLANVLKKVGHRVTKEYYVNNLGAQVEILGESVARRFLQLQGKNVDFPENMYQGEYIVELAKEFKEKAPAFVAKILSDQENESFDIIPEELIEAAKKFAVKKNLENIKKTLIRFGVKFDVWFFESKLKEDREIQNVLNYLDFAGLVYKKDGALWFKATEFGLDKDVVLIKSFNNQPTYLLSDFAYAKNKLSRKFDYLIYILGADHHDDVRRLKVGLKALNLPEEKFVFLLHQLVALKKGEELLRMAKRKGIYVTLDDLLDYISKDAARYFFLEKSLDTHLEFDFQLAKEESTKNPVFYIQYAHARINSVLETAKAKNRKLKFQIKEGLLQRKEELELLSYLVKFPEIIFEISQNYQVHQLAKYALELANKFHRFYESLRILSENKDLTQARLSLAKGVQNVLKETLTIMGISAPEKM